MDNASKALVMAGAILIAVMLISLGVVLFNTASDIAQDTSKQLDSLAIETFNSGFVQMTGTAVKGSTVRTLINKVKSHNGNAEEVALYGTVTINGKSDGSATLDTVGEIDTNKTYKVDIDKYSTTSGAVSNIKITT